VAAELRRAAILALTSALAAAGCAGARTVPPARKRAAASRAWISTHARSFEGAVERHGTLTLLWVRGDESPFAERTRDCLV
jgi:predicted small lipoprotein YifL